MKILGILGGMGPDATVHMFARVIEQTGAQTDQEHLETIIHSNPHIADRTKALLHSGPSPAPEMLRSAKLLEQAGANVIVIPCMTAHNFVRDFQDEIGIPIIHAIEETANFIKRQHATVSTVGILASSGTVMSGIFQSALSERGFETLAPDERSQDDLVMKAIYGERGIKAGHRDDSVLSLLTKAANKLIDTGAGALIAGCTEIPLVLKQEHVAVPLIDPMVVTAQAAVRYCRS